METVQNTCYKETQSKANPSDSEHVLLRKRSLLFTYKGQASVNGPEGFVK